MSRKKKLSSVDRLAFASNKSLSALKWIVASGVATYALLEIQKLLGASESLKDYAPLMMVFINVMLFAIAKYREGEE
jgi:transcription termination factor Rho